MPRPAPSEPQVRFTLRLPRRHVELLRERAAEEERSPSAELRLMIRRRLEEEKAAA
jgi:hypothetical protein